METSGKPEINIEICTGFFRIPTEKAVYNITVLGSSMGSASRIVEKIVDKEKGVDSKAEGPYEPDSEPLVIEGDDFYKAVSKDIYKDIGNLAKSLSSTIMEIPAEDRRGKRVELDEAGEKIEDAKKQLKDIVSMTEKATMEIMDQVESVQGQTNEVTELLSVLKNHKAFVGYDKDEATEKEDSSSLSEEVVEIQGCVARASNLLDDIIAEGGSVSHEETAKEGTAGKRFLFDIDNIFQTIYELCTNETVKGHITNAREKADEIFDKDVFIDNISPSVSELESEDGFITVPLTEVLSPLIKACSDKSITNLLKKMETNQDSIFLDQSIPLELPEIEDVAEEAEASQTGQAGDPLSEASHLLQEGLSKIDELSDKLESATSETSHSNMSMMTLEDQEDIFNKIENALNMATNIRTDIFRITEALSFQDLSGQQIMKIIKLLSDFQVQLLAIVVSFGSQLKSKEQNAQLTVDESKALAQEEVDSYFGQIVEKKEEDEGVLDQDSVNKILEDMGF